MPPTKNRKVIQIATGVDGEWGLALYALCDDGTMWLCYPGSDHAAIQVWARFQDIPSDDDGYAIAAASRAF